jgi:hypothetical protein
MSKNVIFVHYDCDKLDNFHAVMQSKDCYMKNQHLSLDGDFFSEFDQQNLRPTHA